MMSRQSTCVFFSASIKAPLSSVRACAGFHVFRLAGKVIPKFSRDGGRGPNPKWLWITEAICKLTQMIDGPIEPRLDSPLDREHIQKLESMG